MQTVTDSTGAFSVILPSSFAVDAEPFTNDAGVVFAQVSGSENLAAYNEDNDTFGVTVLVAPASAVGTAQQFAELLDPGPEVCADGSVDNTYDTGIGEGTLLLLDGCGTGGGFAKVLVSVSLPAQGVVLVVVAQGTGPADDVLREFAEAIFATVSAA